MNESFGEQRTSPVEQERSEQTIESREETEEEVLERYESRRALARQELTLAKERAESLEKTLIEQRREFGLEGPGDSPILKEAKLRLEQAEKDLIATEANYPGNWSQLLRARLHDPVTKEKFIATRKQSMEHMRPGVPKSFLDKETSYQSYYQNQIDNYDANLEKVMSFTEYGDAETIGEGRKPKELGSAIIGEHPKVFRDAHMKDGTMLDARQKGIIEAHEQGHGLRDFRSVDAMEIKGALDSAKVREAVVERHAREAEVGLRDPGLENHGFGYLEDPREIVERMGQLKNYYGFSSGGDELTAGHVEYAKEHYVEDTGLDNAMSDLFAGITPEKEEAFVEVANKYPI